MANYPSIFAFDSAALRVLRDENGNHWFNANDVCAALALTNPRKAVDDHVDPEDVTKRDTLTPGGTQAVNHVNESGMYALIFGSTKPEAKKFKRWVTSEVLPAIRQTGRYEAHNGAPNIPASLVIETTNAYASTVKAMTRLVGRHQAHSLANAQAKAMGVDLHQIWEFSGVQPGPAREVESPMAKMLRIINEEGTVRRQHLLKRMRCTAVELSALIEQAIASGDIQRLSEPGYAGQVFALKLTGAAA